MDEPDAPGVGVGALAQLEACFAPTLCSSTCGTLEEQGRFGERVRLSSGLGRGP